LTGVTSLHASGDITTGTLQASGGVTTGTLQASGDVTFRGLNNHPYGECGVMVDGSGKLKSSGPSIMKFNTGYSGIPEFMGLVLDMDEYKAGITENAIEVKGTPQSVATQLKISMNGGVGWGMKFADFQVMGESKFAVDKDGSIHASGGVTINPGLSGQSGIVLGMTNAGAADTAIDVTGRHKSSTTQLKINVPEPGLGMRFADFQASGTSMFAVNGDGSLHASGGVSFASLACASADTCCVMVDKSGKLTSGPCDGSKNRRQLAADLGDQVTANHAALAQVVNQQANEIAELKKLVHELLQKTP